MKKLKIFIFICFFCDIQAKKLEDINNDLRNKVALLQTKCHKCIDLNDVYCVKKKINCYFKVDQYIRSKSKSFITNQKFSNLIKEVDLSNTKNLKSILKIHTWPIISKFGKNTDHEAWMLVQHADHDPEFQASIAFILEQLSTTGETDIKHFAYIYDRVAVGLKGVGGIKQKYGTQAMIENNTIKLAPFQGNIKELNLRRQSIGLKSIEEYLNELSKFYKLKALIEQE